MMLPIPQHLCIRPLRPIAFAVISAIALVLAGRASHAGADKSGRWSPSAGWSRGDFQRYAVHMMLLRGDANAHSKILWFQGEDPVGGIFEGGEWLWKSTVDSCRCFAYPVEELFDSVLVGPSGMNPFCAGHAILGGKVLIAGGDDPVLGDYGEIQARLFAPDTWPTTQPPHMFYRRFYPTVTALRDGRGLVTAGSNWRQHRIFGGMRSGSQPSSPVSDSIYRFRPAPPGPDAGWDLPSVYPTADATGRPPVRSGHTAVMMENVIPWGDVFFGGRNASDQPLKDTWVLYRFNDYLNPLLGDGQYWWYQPFQLSDTKPPERSDHSAIIAFPTSGLPGDTCMLIFGGRGFAQGQSYSVLGDIWRFFYDWNHFPQKYAWEHITRIGGTPPAGRFGHGSVPISVEKGRGASSDGIAPEIGFVGSPYSDDLEDA